jgi:hypothetical protein
MTASWHSVAAETCGFQRLGQVGTPGSQADLARLLPADISADGRGWSNSRPPIKPGSGLPDPTRRLSAETTALTPTRPTVHEGMKRQLHLPRSKLLSMLERLTKLQTLAGPTSIVSQLAPYVRNGNRRSALEEATQWHYVLQDAARNERAQFVNWILQSPLHVEAFLWTEGRSKRR